MAGVEGGGEGEGGEEEGEEGDGEHFFGKGGELRAVRWRGRVCG